MGVPEAIKCDCWRNCTVLAGFGDRPLLVALAPQGPGFYAIARQDGEPMMFAGVWDGWRGPDGEILRTYAIVTTSAKAMMATIHNRMPIILERDAWPVWLGEAAGDSTALLQSAAADVLLAWMVGKAVGNVRNNGPELLAPVARALG